MRYLAAIVLVLAPVAGLYGDTVTSAATSTATYNGYYAWGSGASWVWIPGGSDAHYYSDCYPCYFWDNNRFYMEVALPSLTGNITSATLFVNVTGFSDYGENGSANLYHQANANSLTGDAYADRSLLSPDQFVQNILNPGIGWVGFPVTSYIASDYANGSSYAMFGFLPTGNGSGNSQFSVIGPGQDGPYLRIITDAESGGAVPEPATGFLFGIAFAGLFWLARQRRAA
jgi:hypothetical protein